MRNPDATAQLTTAQRIFKVLYYVSVPRNMIAGAEFEAYRGSVASGSATLDQATLDAPTRCHLPIERLAEIHHLIGAPKNIYFSKPSVQSVEIYQAITDHIRNLVPILEKSYTRTNSYEETMKELEMLDSFASWVWLIARNYIKPDDLPAEGSLQHRAAARRTPMSRSIDQETTKQMMDNLPSEHTSLIAPLIEKEFVNRRGGWIG